MKSAEEYLMDLWRRICDYDLHHENRNKIPTYSVLKKSEWSEEFERGMRYRLIIGAFRYGRLGDQNKPKYNRVSDVKNRISRYEKDGNLEHLIDIANICLYEFVEGDHPKRHFKPQDDSEHTAKIKEPVRRKQNQKKEKLPVPVCRYCGYFWCRCGNKKPSNYTKE